ncbi:hypothetical protein FSO04_12070 [Paraburkholderia madseniana]|uniref:Uncharacterized protein n=1 Tax=Paraburkholderia madseniana TaxID=2599607 RepID=A0A6N6WGH7_9BURK|nr:hypothetical protein [Paraburkholderia madseniana]KAE8759636.1 hypothetical protein FSO04_12070 [Paraburkholderia madseniana]
MDKKPEKSIEERIVKLESKSALHTWMPILISGAALVVSIFAAENSHDANEFKKERVYVRAAPDRQCEVNYQVVDEKTSYLWLCWVVEATNLSEDKTGIRMARVIPSEGAVPFDTGQIEVVTGNPDQVMPIRTQKIEHPLKLEAREAQLIVVRMPVQASSQIRLTMTTKVMREIVSSHTLTMRALSNMFPVFDKCDAPGDDSNGQFCTKHFRVVLTTIQNGAYDSELLFRQRVP